jgi:hypothetical protein
VRTIQHWIGGKETSGASSRTSMAWNAATGDQQAQVALASAADVEDAVSVATTACEEWSPEWWPASCWLAARAYRPTCPRRARPQHSHPPTGSSRAGASPFPTKTRMMVNLAKALLAVGAARAGAS